MSEPDRRFLLKAAVSTVAATTAAIAASGVAARAFDGSPQVFGSVRAFLDVSSVSITAQAVGAATGLVVLCGRLWLQRRWLDLD